MSKIGRMPVKIDQGVDILLDKGKISLKGPRGSLSVDLPPGVSAVKEGGYLLLALKKGDDSSLFGTCRALVANAIRGVTVGFEKKLELVGTGFRAEVIGKDLVLSVGFSHPVKITPPEGISFRVEKISVIIEGIDKSLVGQIAAKIRKVRPPEPYKGKGISYSGEVIRRKAGKAAKGPVA